MLQNLSISNLAIVKTLNLDLGKGMSVLTGETGAGKSILLTALGLALGDRADSSYIRPNCSSAEINLEFDLEDAPAAQQWLIDNELGDNSLCLIRRIINQDGRSKAYINNRPVTLQFLQTLSEKLVEIHGQHAHLTLLNRDEQRHLLDEYGQNQAQVEKLNDIFQAWQKTNTELQQLTQTGQEQQNREELLRYQIEELEQLDLENYDYTALSEEHLKQANLGQILTSGQQQLDMLYDNEQQSVNQMLGHCLNELRDLAQLSPEINEVNALLNEAQIQIQEAAQQLRRYLDNQEIDPQRLQWLETQIGIIQTLARKHQITPDRLPAVAIQLQKDLENLTYNSQRIEELQNKLIQLQERYYKAAKQLTEQRKKTAIKLQIQISSLIRELGMPQGDFQILINTQNSPIPILNGLDKIEFQISANPGLPAKPLAKVASGGELSRISLAIQVATSSDKTTPTMIFDEVDSGIGGGIAEIVGRRLRSLSVNRQVFCVTHLPQVACQAHQHLFVSKSNAENTTLSSVKLLNKSERIQEIARMLGGVKITENTLAHAAEMLQTTNKT